MTKKELLLKSNSRYLGTRDNPAYLSLITDAYSKKIVGFEVFDTLASEPSLNALKSALRKEKIRKGVELYHHSDRGIQYCSDDYQKLLNTKQIKCSMNQESAPYENAIAERVNGILKQEYDIDKFNANLHHRKIMVSESIRLYNEKRSHLSNHYLTPRCTIKQN